MPCSVTYTTSVYLKKGMKFQKKRVRGTEHFSFLAFSVTDTAFLKQLSHVLLSIAFIIQTCDFFSLKFTLSPVLEFLNQFSRKHALPHFQRAFLNQFSLVSLDTCSSLSATKQIWYVSLCMFYLQCFSYFFFVIEGIRFLDFCWESRKWGEQSRMKQWHSTCSVPQNYKNSSCAKVLISGQLACGENNKAKFYQQQPA